jgi:hypothetical protein
MESIFREPKMPLETFMFISTLLILSRVRAASLTTLLWTFFLAMCSTPLSPGLGHRNERAAGTVPLWTLDLRTVGFTGFAPKKETWGLNLRPNPLCFSDDQTLIATFITREDVKALARRDNPADLRPDRLHGIFLDAQTGKVQNTQQWSVPRPRGGIIPASDGRFAVLTPAMIALYSSDLDLLKEFRLSSDQQSLLWDLHSSPTGKSILVEYHHPEATYQWLDSNTLQPQTASFSESLPVLSISDDKEIASFRETYVRSNGIVSVHEAIMQQRNGTERTFCRSINGQDDGCDIPEFITNDLLAMWTPHGLGVMPKTGGQALLTARFPDDEWLGRPFPSADGNRVGVAVSEHKGGSAFFDISYHSVLKRIEVYDISSRQRVYSLDAKKQKLKVKDGFGVALSPDGSLLAILVDGVVEVYKLPS